MTLDGARRAELLSAVRACHERIRRDVSACLHQARVRDDRELAARPGTWAAGDLTYALDEVAEAALDAFGWSLAAGGARCVLVAEGPGERVFAPPGGGAGDVPRAEAGESPGGGAGGGPGGAGGPRRARDGDRVPLRAIVDPVDGTRSLMHDMRSAWVVTGVAPDRGAGTRLSDVEIAVQTELPTTSAAVYHVLAATRGGGASVARHDVTTGEALEVRPLRVPGELPLDNGYFAFTRCLPAERPLVAALEKDFLERAIAAHRLSPRLIYDDQYLCSAGQLVLVATGRYRVLADLRGWLAARFELAGFTAKPYDVGALLVFEEAGVPVLDASFAPLDATLDTATPLSVVAFGNERLRQAYEPLLREAMRGLR